MKVQVLPEAEAVRLTCEDCGFRDVLLRPHGRQDLGLALHAFVRDHWLCAEDDAGSQVPSQSRRSG